MFLSSGRYLENEAFFYNNTEMKNNKDERILGVTFENKLKFKIHIKTLCKKASQNIWPLSHLTNCLKNSEKMLIFDTTIKSQFSYRVVQLL